MGGRNILEQVFFRLRGPLAMFFHRRLAVVEVLLVSQLAENVMI